MQNCVSATITFGRHGNSGGHLIAGWSGPEEEHTWSDGGFSSLEVEAPDAPFGFFIETNWRPALKPPYISRQIITVDINSQFVNSFAIDKTGYHAFYCQPLPKVQRRLIVRFRYGNAFRPCDFNLSHDKRLLALCFKQLRIIVLKEPWRTPHGNASFTQIAYSDAAGLKNQAENITGVSINDLLHGFEMLAGNCDLGLALRELEFEKLSLLRFGGASAITSIKGLETDFEGIGEKISFTVANNPSREWMVSDELGLLFHSGQSSLSVEKATVEKSFRRYVFYLRQKFLEDLDEGMKIFVYADHKDCASTRAIEDVLPIYLALRRRSRANMLWVCPSYNDPRIKGSAVEILPGLALGHLDLTAPPVLIGGGITVSGWLSILCSTWQLFHQPHKDDAQ